MARETVNRGQWTGDRRLGTVSETPQSPVCDTSRPHPRLPSPVACPRGGRVGGFTLIELIVVIAIIGILATIAVPAMKTAPQRARESALKEDLFTLRSAIDQFHADRGRYPTSLDELQSMGYIRAVPEDPVTRSTSTWVPVYEDVTDDADERQQSAGQGMIDVHSGSEDTALDGTKYKDW
jgi:general secretion pathway protein G